ncbi:MAG TPA: transporter [Terriglobales bacterium]|nr:transporter [Terriglobales bacterium]
MRPALFEGSTFYCGIVPVLLVALAMASRSRAAQPTDHHVAQPERPTVATHAHTVAPGWVEIEAGIERDEHEDRSIGLASPLETKIGLTPHAQLSLNTPWQRRESGPPSGAGPGDISVGVKWRLLDDAPLLGDFALLPTLKLPSGSAARGTGTGTTDGSLTVISSHEVGRVALDLNAGFTRHSRSTHSTARDATLWTVSTGTTLTESVAWALELFGLPGTSGSAGERPIAALLAGPTFTPRRWLELDAGLIVPISGPQPHALYAGFVWNIGRL